MELYQRCQKWRTLPRSGGVLDQPAGLLDRMEWATTVAQAVSLYDKNWNAPGWLDEHREVLEIMLMVWEVENGAQ